MRRRRKPPPSYRPTRGVFAGQRFSSKSAYRKALAGRAAKRPQRGKTVKGKRTARRKAYERRAALAVLADMRTGDSLPSAAEREGITPQLVRRYAGAALRRDRRGRYRPTRRDRLLRELAFYTPRGRIWLNVRNSDDASRIAQHAAAVGAFLTRGDGSDLRAFRGQKVRVGGVDYPFLTDPVVLTMLGKSQTVEYELYRH